MSGKIKGGPVVADNIDTKDYPAPNGGQPPVCSAGLYPVPPVTVG